MPSPSEPASDQTAADLQAVRSLLDDLRRQVVATLDDVDALLAATAERAPVTFSRPAPVAPRRMEQLARTPEPTADLDDLVDVLAPRLLDRLVPGLRDALREDG